MMTVAGALFDISGMVLTVPAAGAIVAMTAVLRSTTGQRESASGEPDRRQGSHTERLSA
jgi:hypothetical protein